MNRARAARAVRHTTDRWRSRGERVAFVPTMGAIHAGHLSLVHRARRGADRVVASIFVNPLQFGPREDYRKYPRPIRRDRALLRGAGVDLLWEPRVADLFPPSFRTRVRVEELGDSLEGRTRPGHFEGVATVVAKLLHVVNPHELWLGQKDAQQARLLERMIADLEWDVRVRRGPIVREPDGLALSSRNAYLSVEERRDAAGLWKGLREAGRLLARGERSVARLRSAVRRVWRGFPRLREDYVAVVDTITLRPLRRVERKALVLVAAWLGTTRLIDNVEWSAR